MTFDFRRIPHSTNTEPEELAIQRFGNRLADRRFPDTRGPDETEDLALDGATEFSYSDEFFDTILHVCQAVMVFI